MAEQFALGKRVCRVYSLRLDGCGCCLFLFHALTNLRSKSGNDHAERLPAAHWQYRRWNRCATIVSDSDIVSCTAGTILTGLGALKRLDKLDLSYNNLEGEASLHGVCRDGCSVFYMHGIAA